MIAKISRLIVNHDQDNVVKKAMVLVNIIHKESHSFFTYNRLIIWHKMGHLS